MKNILKRILGIILIAFPFLLFFGMLLWRDGWDGALFFLKTLLAIAAIIILGFSTAVGIELLTDRNDDD